VTSSRVSRFLSFSAPLTANIETEKNLDTRFMLATAER